MRETEWTYENGVWTLSNDAVEVVIDEATFDKHFQAYCLEHGIDTRSYAELMSYVTRVERQHYEAQQFLCHPEYWFGVSDANIHMTKKEKGEEQSMGEQQEPLQLPLVAPVYTSRVRAGLRGVFFGLAQYINQFPDDSKEKELCMESLDTLVRRFQVGSVEDTYLSDHEIGQVLEAIGGFLLTLYNLQPPDEKNTIRLFITDWGGRLKLQFPTQQ